MRQVPRYLLIGNGRVAKHFQRYFSLLNISFESWCRHQSQTELHEKIQRSTHILVLISDHAIEKFILDCYSLEGGNPFKIDSRLRGNDSRVYIHFSGSLTTPLAYGAHPLTTFSHEMYNLEQYQKIPFIVDQDAPDFKILFPELPNQHVRLEKSQKAKYHALCVLSGNFSCMLWQKIFSDFEREFNIPNSIAHPYLKQVTHNLLNNYESALTGPLVRGDQATIEKNLFALDSDPYQAVYKTFIDCYQRIQKEETA